MRAQRYFELRDRALRMDQEEDSNASAVYSFTFSEKPEHEHLPAQARAKPPKTAAAGEGLEGRPKHPVVAGESGSRISAMARALANQVQNSDPSFSLVYSQDTSVSHSQDAEPRRRKVISL